jgi:hypothetical protein
MTTILTDQIMETMHHAIVHGASNVMRDSEVARGYRPVFPGDFPWFPASEWPQDVVVSLDGNRVRIIAVYALNPGNGAFSRLITGIVRAGLIPTVVAPFSEMVDILTHWGWHRRIVGKTFNDRCDEWFPTRKWREQRNE